MPELQRIRRGLGAIFCAFGCLHTLAAFFGLGGRAYFAAYLCLIAGGLGYLFHNFRAAGTFYYETLADFLVGVGLFVVLMSPVVGLILAAYGLGLRRGRALGFFHARVD